MAILRKNHTINGLGFKNVPTYFERFPLPGKAKWTKALRSGDYLQGRERLCQGDRYCCLGVLSKIQGRLINDCDNGWDSALSCLAHSNVMYKFIGIMGDLPDEIQVSPDKSGIHCYVSLAYLNDYGVSFNGIASIIDALWYDPEFENPGNYHVF